jgi:molybdopterin converting factor subunit 1
MIVHVRLFARARDLAGADSVAVELPDGASVADLRRRLAADHPRLAGLLERSALAVENEFAEDTLPLSASAEIALLPPVSGGQAAATRLHGRPSACPLSTRHSSRRETY